MKFLLVGFSEQAQNALELLLSREFTGHSYQSVPRQLSSFLYPVVPEISAEILEKHDACIIDLDGIGMINFDEKHRTQLMALIRKKSAILISRQIEHLWQDHVPLWTNAHIEYLNQPYTKDEMGVVLKRILAKELRETTAYTSQQPETNTKAETNVVESEPASVFQEKAQLPAISYRSKFIQALLKQRWTEFDKQPVLQHLLTIFSQSQPFKLEVSQHELLVIPEQNKVLVAKPQSVIDYFALLKSFKISTFHIESKPVVGDVKQLEADYLKSGAMPYQLGLFLWQIYQEVLPEDFKIDHENLYLKAKYMPDFSNMSNVPTYMNSVISSCLNKAQPCTGLKTIFPFLSVNNLNRVFILAVLCNYAEIESFEPLIQFHAQSTVQQEEPKQKNEAQPVVEQNSEIVKARRVGLLERLLAKLNF